VYSRVFQRPRTDADGRWPPGRWIHKNSGRSYHVKNVPPKSMKLDAAGKCVAPRCADNIACAGSNRCAATCQVRQSSRHDHIKPLRTASAVEERAFTSRWGAMGSLRGSMVPERSHCRC
jgi:hypothetical protein